MNFPTFLQGLQIKRLCFSITLSLACLLAACTPAVSARDVPDAITMQAALPVETWELFASDVAGFELSAPPTWLVISADEPEFAEFAFGYGMNLEAAGVDMMLYGVDMSDAAELSTSVNLLRMEMPVDLPLSVMLRVNANVLESMPGLEGEISSTEFDSTFGEVGELSYRARIDAPYDNTVYALRQFFFVKEGFAYVFTFATYEDFAPAYEPVVNTMLSTLSVQTPALELPMVSAGEPAAL